MFNRNGFGGDRLLRTVSGKPFHKAITCPLDQKIVCVGGWGVLYKHVLTHTCITFIITISHIRKAYTLAKNKMDW